MIRFLFLILLLIPAVLRAEPVEIASSLTLDQLVATALAENPQLKASRTKVEAMEERPAQEQALPNPMFKYSGMDATNRGTWPNTNEKRFMLEQPFPWFGKRGLKGQIAKKDAIAEAHMYEAMTREVVMMVKESYFDLYAVQQSLTITRTEEDVLNRMAKIAETKYGTGTASQTDVLKAQTEITMLQQKRFELEQQEATLKAKLNQLLNRRADAPLGFAVTAPVEAFDLTFDQLLSAARKYRHELQYAQTEIERNKLSRDLMKKESFPDYTLGVEYRNIGNAEDMVMFTVGIEFPIWQNKNKAGVREAEKMIDSSTAALQATQQQIGFDVRDAGFKLVTARRSLDLYRKQLIPQAKMRFESSEAGYRTGKVDFLDLLESERFLLNARVMAVMAEGNVGMELARLERAVGTDLSKVEEKK